MDILGMFSRKKAQDQEISWRFFLTAGDAQKAMLEAVRSAKKTIECEQYIFDNDETGIAFFEAFLEKRKQGVRVRLLSDHVGSFYFFSSEWPGKLRDAGVEVQFFNIISPWRLDNFTRWFFRDHRKLMVVDDTVGFIGGVGIAGYMKDWRDTHLRIEGNIALALRENFDEIWSKSKRRTIFGFRLRRHTAKKFEYLTNAPRYRERFIYHTLIDAVRSAKHSILLTTPYFVPDGRFFRAIRLAARRGVNVRLIIPERSDVRWFHIATHSYLGRLLKSGARVFKYQSAILHAKTVVIDGNWATVGSLNLDNLSFLWNYESNIVSSDQKFIGELARHFEEDIRNSKEIHFAEWQNRPIFDRMLEYISLPIHRFL